MIRVLLNKVVIVLVWSDIPWSPLKFKCPWPSASASSIVCVQVDWDDPDSGVELEGRLRDFSRETMNVNLTAKSSVNS